MEKVVWPTLGWRTAEEQNRTYVGAKQSATATPPPPPPPPLLLLLLVVLLLGGCTSAVDAE